MGTKGLSENTRERSPELKPHKRLVGAYVPDQAYDEIKSLAEKEDKPIQAVLCDALNEHLKRHNRPVFTIPKIKLGRPRKTSWPAPKR